MSENVEKVRKKRTPKTPQQLLQEALDIQKKAHLAQARESLNSVQEYTAVKGTAKEVSEYISEARGLVDEEAFKAKEAALMQRLTKLREKRAVAKQYLATKEAAFNAFERAQTQVGELVNKAIGTNPMDPNIGSRMPTTAQLRNVLMQNITAEQLAILSDSADPFAEFRRAKEEEKLAETANKETL